MNISGANPDELAEALTILYGPGSESQVGHAFRMVARGEISPSDLLVARSGLNIVGAIFARLLPGSIALIWPPRGTTVTVEDELVQAGLKHVANAKAIQAFMPPEEVRRAEPLLRAGFQHVTRIWQMEMRHRVGGATRSAGASRLTASPLLACDSAVYKATLLRAHENSLDCPELNRVLTPAEVLAGYHDAAPDLSRWFLACDREEPVGVLILDAQNLMFLGVVPEQRCKGIGRWMLELALDVIPNLCLNVDLRNAPAFQLYRSTGCEVVGAREVYFYFPKSADRSTEAKVFQP